MVVLSFQPVQFPRTDCRCSVRQARVATTRCIIAEPSGVPAPLGEKTKYNDGLFAKVFMSLFARKMEKFAAKEVKRNKKKEWWEIDYENFVDVSKRVMQGRSRLQQQQAVREVLLSMLPPGAPAQVVRITKYTSQNLGAASCIKNLFLDFFSFTKDQRTLS